MSRKSSVPEAAIPGYIEEIYAYMKLHNTNAHALAKAAGVSQSSLARFLYASRKSVTPSAQKVLDFIHKRHNRHKPAMPENDTLRAAPSQRDSGGLELINAAVMELWDGERRTATVIASLISALKPAFHIVMAAGSQDSTGS